MLNLAYKEYKDSGIDAIGDIPKHWKVLPIKFTLAMPITDGPHETPKLYSEGIPFLSAEAVKEDKLDFDKKRGFISIEDHKRFSLKYKPLRGDVYMVKSGATTGNVARVETDAEYNIWSPLAALRPDQRYTTTDFIFFYMKSKPFFYSVELSWSYGTQQNIGMGIIANLKMALPPLNEQLNINRYITHKTAQIDNLIAKKKQLIEKLNEKRIAVITQAVTKGLDPDVPMKDSGVDWLGEVPGHWTCGYKLNFLATDDRNSFVNGPFGSDLLTSELVNEGVPVIYSGDVKESGFYRKSDKYVTEEKAQMLDFCRVDGGDVLLAKVGAPPGDSCVYPIGEPNAIATQDVVRIRINSLVIDPYYLSHLFNSNAGRHLIKLISVEATRGRFSLADLKLLRVPIPPFEEQQKIVQKISLQTDLISEQIKLTQNTITKLQEYRTALITSAVTGKIDVRNVKVPENVAGES